MPSNSGKGGLRSWERNWSLFHLGKDKWASFSVVCSIRSMLVGSNIGPMRFDLSSRGKYAYLLCYLCIFRTRNIWILHYSLQSNIWVSSRASFSSGWSSQLCIYRYVCRFIPGSKWNILVSGGTTPQRKVSSMGSLVSSWASVDAVDSAAYIDLDQAYASRDHGCRLYRSLSMIRIFVIKTKKHTPHQGLLFKLLVHKHRQIHPLNRLVDASWYW